MSNLDYGQMMQAAFRGVMASALRVVEKNGLTPPHHFYITVNTTHPEVDLPDWLAKDYPEEIIIALQYEFWDLKVTDTGFSVGISFNNHPASLVIPFAAITVFADPGAEFGLKFDMVDEEGEDEDEEVLLETLGNIFDEAVEVAPESDKPDEIEGKVVELDAFRKK